MNKKIIGIIIAISLLLLIVFGGFRTQNNPQVIDDGMDKENTEMMDTEKDSDMKDEGKEEVKVEIKDESNEMMKNEGEMAKDFTLKDLDGNDVTLSSLQGEKVYLKFWASWCSICLAGLEDLDILAGESDFKVITIVSPGFNGEKSTEDFKEWFNNQETKNLEVLLDEGGLVTKEYGVRAYPTSVYIGSDGVLVKVLPGHNNNDIIRDFIKDIN